MLTAGEKENVASIRRLLERDLPTYKYSAASLVFDLIERLEAENDRLREQLAAIRDPLGIGAVS